MEDPATAPFEPANDAIFIAGLRKALPAGITITDSQIFELIDLSCTLLSHGTTGKEIQESFIEIGGSLSEVGTTLRIIRIGVANYCPAHLPECDFLVEK